MKDYLKDYQLERRWVKIHDNNQLWIYPDGDHWKIMVYDKQKTLFLKPQGYETKFNTLHQAKVYLACCFGCAVTGWKGRSTYIKDKYCISRSKLNNYWQVNTDYNKTLKEKFKTLQDAAKWIEQHKITHQLDFVSWY